MLSRDKSKACRGGKSKYYCFLTRGRKSSLFSAGRGEKSKKTRRSRHAEKSHSSMSSSSPPEIGVASEQKNGGFTSSKGFPFHYSINFLICWKGKKEKWDYGVR